MARKKGPGIVVDASVARAAGGPGTAGSFSTRNTRFLNAMTETSCPLVMTSLLSQEWSAHQTVFSGKWRSTMVAKKLFKALKDTELEHLDGQIEDFAFSAIPEQNEKARQDLLKDKHLLEAAMASDKRIASCEHRSRELSRHFAQEHHSVARILWVDPAQEDEEPLHWLKKGAPHERHRLLGHPEQQ